MRFRGFLLGILLRCYPADFRRRHGDELKAMARDVLAEGDGSLRRLRVWAGLVLDAVTQGAALRLGTARSAMGAPGPWLVDGKQAARALLRRPGFTLLCVATLGVGIGAVTVAFSLFYSVILRPLPFPEANRLVGLWHAAPGLRPDDINQSPASYFLYRENNRVFDDLGLWDQGEVTVTGLDRPERVTRLLVTGGLLPTLGFPVRLGRAFLPEDDRPGAEATTILTHPYWLRRFGGDAGVIGRTLDLDGEPHEIIGVLHEGFLFTDPALLTPARFDRSAVMNGDFSYQIIARLGSGVSMAEAHADLERLLPRLATDYDGHLTPTMLSEAEFRPVVRTLREDYAGDREAPLWMLLGVVSGVLLIACANVGNLFLARAESRQPEMATRTAMGASGWSVIRTLLAESMLLALLAGAAGLLLAVWGLKGLVAYGPEILREIPALEVSLPVVTATLAISALSGIFFALLTFIRLTGRDLAGTLVPGFRDAGGGPGRARVRDGLVVTQVALAAVLLVGSGLMVRSFQAMRAVDPGFVAPDELITVRLSFAERTTPGAEQVALKHRAVLDALEAIPGIASAGASTSVTMDGRDSHSNIYFEAFPVTVGELPAVHRVKFIAGSYAETMGIPVVAGRTLTRSDLEDRRRAVVVSEDLALRYWGRPAEALGQRLGFEPGQWWEIVGVTGPVHDEGLHRETVPIVYFPMVGARAERDPYAQRTMTHVLRTEQPSALLPLIREAIWSVDADLPLTDLGTHAKVVRRSLGQTAFAMFLLLAAAATALLLGTVGVYSVLSYLVSQRTREIGVRMALGADRGAVGRLILSRGTALVGSGMAIGLVASATLASFAGATLFGVRTLDPLTYATVGTGLALVATAAVWLPARRAARIDPIEALRWE